jgi:hypothetical protein
VRAPEIYAAFMGICAGEFFKTTKALLSGSAARQKAKVERKALRAPRRSFFNYYFAHLLMLRAARQPTDLARGILLQQAFPLEGFRST